jgi:AraC-like DNA-binding protein/mannose-6-phosphate isomerase-like protein (cupin superfamily)
MAPPCISYVAVRSSWILGPNGFIVASTSHLFLSIEGQIISKLRQTALFDPVGHRSALIAPLHSEYDAGHVFAEHFHERDQLIYACQGVMTVTTKQGTWVVPTQRAVWIPSPVPHAVRTVSAVSLRTLYLKRGLARALPRDCCVLNVSALLRELIVHACTFPTLTSRVRTEAHLINIILDQLKTIEHVPLRLPAPMDPRAKRVAQMLTDCPDNERSLNEICRLAGASRRTIERCFFADTAMSLGKWRQHLRLLHALQLLAEGEKVAHVATATGYSTPSSFASAFKTVLGTTPGRYFEAAGRSTANQNAF